MRNFTVPLILVALLIVSLIFLVFEKNQSKDVHILIHKEIYKMSPAPDLNQVKIYTEAVNAVAIHASKCLTYSDVQSGACKDSYALDLVRALKMSDSIYDRTKNFKKSPFHFFENSVAPKLGIQDISCHLENKKPVCKVTRG